MTKDQIREAIEQMKSHCRLQEEIGDYDSISARGTLYTLGYTEDQANEVLQTLFDGGFTYCLDPDFHKSPSDQHEGMMGTRISAGVCHWGPDQLRSRLECV
jgi:hypothetical protein